MSPPLFSSGNLNAADTGVQLKSTSLRKTASNRENESKTDAVANLFMNLSLIFLVLQILLFACTCTINVLAIDLLCPLICIHTIGIAKQLCVHASSIGDRTMIVVPV